MSRERFSIEGELIGNLGSVESEETEHAIALFVLPRVGGEPRVVETDVGQGSPSVETEVAFFSRAGRAIEI